MQYPGLQRLPAQTIRNMRIMGLAVLAAAPAFLGYAFFILNHFYRFGAVLLDVGLLANLSWHEPAALPVPVLGIATFYAFHIAPVFAALSALSWIAPLSMAQWFAIFTGAAHAMLAVAVFWILITEYSMEKGRGAVLAVLLSIAFSFNGLAIAQVRYPHFEIFLAANVIMLLVAWRRRQYMPAALFLIVSLICREDAGFHLFSLLAVLVAMNRWNGVKLCAQKPALVFLAIGLFYSAGMLLLQHALFPGHSSFVRVYTGAPLFSHIDFALVKTRLQFFAVARSYILLPALCAAAWAIITRNPYILAGYIAFIPWTILNLLAKSELAGAMSSYYGFPYLIAAFWPLIGCRMGTQNRPRPLGEGIAGFGLMILASFTSLSAQHNPSGIGIWRGFTDPPTLGRQEKLEGAMTAILHDHGELGRLHVGDGVASLRPMAFKPNETVWDGPLGSSDTVLFFEGERNHQPLADLAAKSGLRYHYGIEGTPIQVVTNIQPSKLPALGPLLTPGHP